MILYIYYLVLFMTVIWFLAVYKMFVLDDDEVSSGNNNNKLETIAISMTKDIGSFQSGKAINNINKYKRDFISHKDKNKKNNIFSKKSSDKERDITVPISSEWLYIRSSKDYKIDSKDIIKIKPLTLSVKNSLRTETATQISVKTESKPSIPTLKKASELQWPPVLADGTVSIDEGMEEMPLIGLKVPRFWEPPAGTTNEQLHSMGRKVNGQETIFLMIASYRDFQCRETITSAFSRSDHPERLFVGAVDQTVPGDIGCLDIEVPCSQDPSQPICKYRDQISIYHMDAQYATGPVTARHIGDRMFRNEYYVMQMDAHCMFVRHWDTKLIQQFVDTGNEMAVLSSYLTDVQGSFTPDGDSTRNTRPIMCNSDYEGAMPARYLRHGAQPECEPEIHDMPQLQPFWAAGFSFSRGHFKVKVPYDAYQPMVFQGEEIAIGIRGFTHGYDFYAPRDSVVFHEYAVNSKRRNKIHMFWENNGKHSGDAERSYKRGTAVIGMAPDLDPNTWDHSELDRYGLGKERDLQLFYTLFLIDAKERKATQLCPFVKSGVMHRDFQPYVRKDRIGIDYKYLMEYNTKNVLDNHLGKVHPYWERNVMIGMESKNRQELEKAVETAYSLGLDLKNPSLISSAVNLLSTL